MQRTIRVIGIGDNGKDSLLPLYRKWIEESDLLVGGERHLGFFPDYEGETLAIKGGLSAVVQQIEQTDKDTVVLASGDPLFYGVGSYLAKKLPVEIYPGISSIQQAFALMKENWHDCAFLSVHGRSMKGLVQKVDGMDKVCLLTDEENNPASIARYLLSFGVNEYKAFIAENLGGAGERTSWLSIEEMAEREFSPLNLVILKRTDESPSWPLGIPDEQFAQRKPDKGLITKKEIRVLSLAALQLKPDSTVWDIGTCTGSMAIEAARICRQGAVLRSKKMRRTWKTAARICGASAPTLSPFMGKHRQAWKRSTIRMPCSSAAVAVK